MRSRCGGQDEACDNGPLDLPEKVEVGSPREAQAGVDKERSFVEER